MQFRLTRASDWPATLHAACDRYEAATRALPRAKTLGELEQARAEYAAANRVYGRQHLALDKQRRPEMYRP